MKYTLNDLNENTLNNLATKLNQGGIAVIPTDTQYGIVTSALQKSAVEKIYQLRKRSSEKPMIILISDFEDIKKFHISLSDEQLSQLKKLWPNPLSIILPATGQPSEYLHRGTNSLAFRIPKLDWLQKFLYSSGPLVAPSANFEGETPASSIKDAEKYFKDQLDFSIDAGTLKNPPSTVIKLTESGFEIIRQGAFTLPA